jgi:hypothetical protein
MSLPGSEAEAGLMRIDSACAEGTITAEYAEDRRGKKEQKRGGVSVRKAGC